MVVSKQGRHGGHVGARHGLAWHGMVWLARHGRARLGKIRLGLAGVAWQGSARLGWAGQGRQGWVRFGMAWLGRAWQAWHGPMRLGVTRYGRAGVATMRPRKGCAERERMPDTTLLYPRVPHMCNDQAPGLFTDQIVMHPPAWMGLSRKEIAVDRCMGPVIQALWDAGIVTRYCCCGHGRIAPSVAVEVGDDRFPPVAQARL